MGAGLCQRAVGICRHRYGGYVTLGLGGVGGTPAGGFFRWRPVRYGGTSEVDWVSTEYSWLLVPCTEGGLCSYLWLKTGAVDLIDLCLMHDHIAATRENERRQQTWVSTKGNV